MFLRERVKPDLPQEQSRVLRRGRVRDGYSGVFCRDDEPQGVGIGGEVTGLDEAHDQLLLVLGVLDGTLVGVGHPEVVERGAGAVHARLAGDVLLVDKGGERVRRPRGTAADVAPAGLHQLLH